MLKFSLLVFLVAASIATCFVVAGGGDTDLGIKFDHILLDTSAPPTFTIPTNLCQEDSQPFYGIVNDTENQKFYFLSYDLCKTTTLYPSILSDKSCTPSKGEWQIAQLPGNAYSKDYPNTDCGRIYSNSTVLARNDSNQVVVKFYNEPANNAIAYVTNNITSDFLLLTITCVPESVLIADVALKVTNVTWDDQKVTSVSAQGVCKEKAAPGGDKGTPAGVYVAIAVVLTFVCLFASVLYRAKLAGDRLRQLKRARGEKAFLG